MELRPSAATTRAALSVPPSASSRLTHSSVGVTLTTADVGSQRSRDSLLVAAKSAALRAELAMLAPKLARPSSSALNSTSGARSRPPRSSTMRTPCTGALSPAQPRQTPRFFSNSTLPSSSAVVRLSASARAGSWAGAAMTTSAPSAARARAAASPAGPAPTTATSVVGACAMRRVLRHFSAVVFRSDPALDTTGEFLLTPRGHQILFATSSDCRRKWQHAQNIVLARNRIVDAVLCTAE